MKGDFTVTGENMWEQVRKLWIKYTIICFKPAKKAEVSTINPGKVGNGGIY